MSRIQNTFSNLKQTNQRALIPFIMAGDPDPSLTVTIMHTLVAGGADILELGIPFSDPVADGPIIQRASGRALAKGINLTQIFSYVQDFRKQNKTTPIVLMGYVNPIERFGFQQFAKCAQQVGVDGILIVDYPPEEAMSFVTLLRQYDIDPIFLLAPTSTKERMLQLQQLAKGYVYYVSLRGVTGSSALQIDSVAYHIPLIKQYLDIPIAVGFGIRDVHTARAIGRIADAVVIGSRLVQLLEETSRAEVLQYIHSFCTQIRTGLDTAIIA